MINPQYKIYLSEKWKKRVLIMIPVLLGGVVFSFMACSSEPVVEEISTEVDAEESVEELLVVHVSGAVLNADNVYLLPVGSRVMDAIEAAGGATDEADLSRLNLAAPVCDAQKVYVPYVWEETETESEEDGRAQTDSLININTADVSQLMTLPGIGEVYASRIVEYRKANGKFATIEEIKNVKGIGESLYAKIKELITV